MKYIAILHMRPFIHSMDLPNQPPYEINVPQPMLLSTRPAEMPSVTEPTMRRWAFRIRNMESPKDGYQIVNYDYAGEG